MDLIAVIDLGEVPAGQALDETPVRPWPHRRWLLVALALGFALVTVGGSAAAPRPLPMTVLPAPAGSAVSLAGDRLFVVEPDRPGVHRHVAAYRLTDLEQLWRVELPTSGCEDCVPEGDRGFLRLMAVGGTIVLAGEQPGAGLSSLGLDSTTGAVRWRLQAALGGPTTGGLLLLSEPHPDSGKAPGGAELDVAVQTVRAVHPDTADLAWSLEVPAGALHSSRFDGAKLALLAIILPSGRVELRDVDTGKLLRSRQIRRPPVVPGAGTYAEIIGDLLVVREASATVAYGLDRLDLRWRLPVAAGYDGWPLPCGTAICFLREGGGVTVVDQLTGRRKWSDPRWSGVLTEVGGYLIASGGRPDDQIVVALDPDTGRVRRELGSWQQLLPDSGAESIIGIRYEVTHTVVARIDPARGARILAVLRDIAFMTCDTEPSRLLCMRTDNTLAMWRLPG